MKFNIIIEKDDEGRYVADCPDLPGCLSEGESLKDALENVIEAISGCQNPGSRTPAERLEIASFDRRLDNKKKQVNQRKA